MKKVPNILCICRIALTPIIIFIMLYSEILVKVFPFTLLYATDFGKELAQFLDPGNSFGMIIAGVIFVIAMLTDLFDGLIARKYNAISDLGKVLDPFADKLLILGTLISFFLLDSAGYEFLENPEQQIMLVPILIIIIREVFVTVMRSIAQKKGVYVAANIWGKAKTVSQTAAIIIYFFSYFIHYTYFGRIAVIIASVITLISVFPYIKTFREVLKEQKD